MGKWPFLNLENVLFDGTGWTGWTGGTGWTEYQKCPLKFFILCRYIDKDIPTYTCDKKISPRFLWVLDVKLGVWVKIFKFTAGR